MPKGNPNPSNQFKKGNTVAADAYRWQYAVRRSVLRHIGNGRNKVVAIDALADALVDAGIAGDIGAIKEVGNRLDGMAHQSISVDQHSNDRSISVQLSFVRPNNANVIEHDATPMVEQASDTQADVVLVGSSYAEPDALLVDDDVAGC